MQNIWTQGKGVMTPTQKLSMSVTEVMVMAGPACFIIAPNLWSNGRAGKDGKCDIQNWLLIES